MARSWMGPPPCRRSRPSSSISGSCCCSRWCTDGRVAECCGTSRSGPSRASSPGPVTLGPPPWRSSCSMPPGSLCRKGSGISRGLSSGRSRRLFYLAWTLVLIGAFLPEEAAGGTAPPDRPRVPIWQPLYGGILLAMWATSTMTVGHLLLATTVTGYLSFDSVWEASMTRARRPHGAYSFQGKRVTG